MLRFLFFWITLQYSKIFLLWLTPLFQSIIVHVLLNHIQILTRAQDLIKRYLRTYRIKNNVGKYRLRLDTV